MRFSLTNNMPLRKYLPSWGEGKGNTQTYGGTDGYKFLERYPLLSQRLIHNRLKVNTRKSSGYYSVGD